MDSDPNKGQSRVLSYVKGKSGPGVWLGGVSCGLNVQCHRRFMGDNMVVPGLWYYSGRS